MCSAKPTNPYADLPQKAFWKSAVAAHNPLEISELWRPAFAILPTDKVVTAGSCFAQHFSRALSARGYRWLDAEPAPALLTEEQARSFNYGIFSVRTGNIYTARMLRQWLQLAMGATDAEAPEWTEVWQAKGRVQDPLRPVIEPGGFASSDELFASRSATLAALRRAVRKADVFVFTMGLTESWRNRKTGMEYALCPGSAGGVFDPEVHVFHNQRYSEILEDMSAALELMRAHNPRLKVLLTVSPVPLTATASGEHVLTATSYSKSVLRAVAGDLAADHDDVDYFPSYEIITHPAFRGMFYASNQRSVIARGVDHVMESFFAAQQAHFPQKTARTGTKVRSVQGDRGGRAVKCEEEMLDAFAR